MVLLDPIHPFSSEARLEQLEKQRASYYQLLQNLETLPRKLRHPGLIPVAPRLFLQGELVRTNEVLVLLGRSGDETFLAERSAWQAKGIVQRRLDIVDQKVKHFKDTKDDHIQYTISKNDTFLPSILVDSSRPSTRKSRRKRVTFKEPLHTEFNPTNTQKLSKPQTNLKQPIEQQNNKTNLTSLPIPQQPQLPLKSQRRKKSKDKQSNKTQKTPPQSKEEENNLLPTVDLTSNKESTSATTQNDTITTEREQVKSEFTEAIRNAHTQQLQEGVVNITEFYENGSDDPVKIEMPSNFKPDETIDFDDDAKTYLDITGDKKDEPVQDLEREDYWNALIEAEKEEEEKEKERIQTEAKSKLDREKKEFGTGFSKGFFGASTNSKKKQMKKKQTTTNAQPPIPSANATNIEVITSTVPISDVNQKFPTQSEQETHFGIKERIVERKSKSSKNKTSKRRSQFRNREQKVPVLPVVDSLLVMENDDAEEDAEEIRIEDDDEDTNRKERKSQFKQLRNLQRQGA